MTGKDSLGGTYSAPGDRRWRRIGGLALIGAVVATVGGARMAERAREIEAEKFVLRDQEGRVRATLGLVDDVTARLGGIDVLVNNAGVNIKERQFRQLTPLTWRQLVAGNLDGACHCMLAVLPQMRERKDGLIVNVNSISGKRASPLGGTGYIAAKFGLRGLAMAVAA